MFRALRAIGENVLSGMIGANMLIQIAALLRPVQAVRTFKLRLLAALVSRVSQQSAAMLITLAALLATIRELASLLDRPEHLLHQRHTCGLHHREEKARHVRVFRQNHTRS